MKHGQLFNDFGGVSSGRAFQVQQHFWRALHLHTLNGLLLNLEEIPLRQIPTSLQSRVNCFAIVEGYRCQHTSMLAAARYTMTHGATTHSVTCLVTSHIAKNC